MSLFLRRYSLILGQAGTASIEMTEAEIQFRIEKTNTSEQNKMNLKIYNVNPTHRNSLNKKDMLIIFKVGYNDQALKTVFQGNLVDIKSSKDNTDMITEINAGDGHLQLRQSRSSHSFESGITVREVTHRLVNDFNQVSSEQIAIKSMKGDALEDVYQNGISISGSTKQTLDKLLGGKGLQWSIQNGAFEVNPSFAANLEEVVYLSAKTGLIGIPEFMNVAPGQLAPIDGKDTITQDGIRFVSLLNPNIEPARRVQIESPPGTVKTYTVQKVTHTGDFRGNEWISTAEATQTK